MSDQLSANEDTLFSSTSSLKTQLLEEHGTPRISPRFGERCVSRLCRRGSKFYWIS